MANTRAERLARIRESLERIVEAQTAAWEAAGCPPDWSVDGESVNWSSWLQNKLDAVEKLSEQITRAQPFWVRSRHRG